MKKYLLLKYLITFLREYIFIFLTATIFLFITFTKSFSEENVFTINNVEVKGTGNRRADELLETRRRRVHPPQLPPRRGMPTRGCRRAAVAQGKDGGGLNAPAHVSIGDYQVGKPSLYRYELY